MYVPCGKCYECQSKNRADWAFRAKEELSVRPNAYFCTFTYSNEYLPTLVIDDDTEIECVWKPHVSDLIKKFQDFFADNFGRFEYKKYDKIVNGVSYSNRVKHYTFKPLIRYYITSEYGSERHRPHYHALIFLPNCADCIDLHKFTCLCRKLWSFGNVDVQRVTRANINYVQKHQVKYDKGTLLQQIYAPIFSTMSRYRGGLGISYLEKIYDVQKELGRNNVINVVNGSYRMPLPKFYLNKIFDKRTDSELIEIATKQNQLHYSKYVNWISQYYSAGLALQIKDFSIKERLPYNMIIALYFPDLDVQRVRVWSSEKLKFIYQFDKNSVYYQFRDFLRRRDDNYRYKYDLKKHTQFLFKIRYKDDKVN